MRRTSVRVGLCALALAILTVGAGPAAALDEEVRRMEAVGAFPIHPNRAPTAPPRDAAVRAAVRDAVWRIARALLPPDFVVPLGADEGEGVEEGELEVAPEEVPDDEAEEAAREAWLDEVLGDDPFEFATRFRILEDRGVRPALLSAAPGVENEYVVVVEVYVDAGRVLERLRSTGALLEPSGDESLFRIWLVAEGIDSFASYDALRRALAAAAGVRAVLPIELQRGRVEFKIDAERDVSAVLDELLTVAPPSLRIIPLESQDDRVTVLVDWREPESLDAEGPSQPARDANPRD
jgi:hypothetical protein